MALMTGKKTVLITGYTTTIFPTGGIALAWNLKADRRPIEP